MTFEKYNDCLQQGSQLLKNSQGDKNNLEAKLIELSNENFMKTVDLERLRQLDQFKAEQIEEAISNNKFRTLAVPNGDMTLFTGTLKNDGLERTR